MRTTYIAPQYRHGLLLWFIWAIMILVGILLATVGCAGSTSHDREMMLKAMRHLAQQQLLKEVGTERFEELKAWHFGGPSIGGDADGSLDDVLPAEPLDGAGYWIVGDVTCRSLTLQTVRNEHPRAGKRLVFVCPDLAGTTWPAALWLSTPSVPIPLDSLGAPGCQVYCRPVVEFGGGAGRWPVTMNEAGSWWAAQVVAVTNEGLQVSNAVGLRVGR